MSTARSLGEIIDELLNPTEEQIATERHRELSFRRGYHHGWDRGMETIFRLLDAGMPRDEAYALCARHVNEIADWRVRRPFVMAEPPMFGRAVVEAVVETGDNEESDEE